MRTDYGVWCGGGEGLAASAQGGPTQRIVKRGTRNQAAESSQSPCALLPSRRPASPAHGGVVGSDAKGQGADGPQQAVDTGGLGAGQCSGECYGFNSAAITAWTCVTCDACACMLQQSSMESSIPTRPYGQELSSLFFRRVTRSEGRQFKSGSSQLQRQTLSSVTRLGPSLPSSPIATRVLGTREHTDTGVRRAAVCTGLCSSTHLLAPLDPNTVQ